MGFSISWLGLRGLGIEEAAALLQVEVGDQIDAFDAPMNAYANENWAIVILDECRFPGPPDQFLAAISKGRELVVVHIEEHVMFSHAELWRDGRSVWKVGHSGDQNVRDLHATGDLSASFETLRQQAFSKQDEEDDVDYVFDIPLDLAAELTSFRHDEWAPDRLFFELVEKRA
ncbi:hypothetical protein FJV76_01400 [Mesorhizobium sp. WSM4303]|uniref:hypothetical protein n=1 Tax=unclassified Mesorhizobium TaxID=325217 RepID=UPI00115DBE26|nr:MULTISPECIES: hypothetical protein [unclassified Mesorhizobium]TRC95441.1 hypothetical protein FJV77_15890 [Mesorhizobium sp. WSM4306]TRD08961.1 hypothetical protein FJV76_01400 [Mesorhizobium sp. WSM4303]